MDKDKIKQLAEVGLTPEDIEVSPWDPSEYLDSPEMIQGYLQESFATGDMDIIIMALGDVAKAIGMTEIAKKSGLNRQNLYRALAPGSKPQFETIAKVSKAMGCPLTV